MTLPLEELERHYAAAKALYDRGQVDDALTTYRRLANLGYEAALFSLGRHAFDTGANDEARTVLARLQEFCELGNAQACVSCYLGFRRGWAKLGHVEDMAMGSKYLLRAAELGDTYSQYALALEHLGGSNGQIKDEVLYLHWIDKAIEGGSEDAVYEHVKFLLDKRRPVPPALIADLEVLAREYSAAAKLFARVKRTQKND